MGKFAAITLAASLLCGAAELSTKKVLNLATVKALVVVAEAEEKKRDVQVTICIVDEAGKLLFLEKADGACEYRRFRAAQSPSFGLFQKPFQSRGRLVEKRQHFALSRARSLSHARRPAH